jgi:hypothetical protein
LLIAVALLANAGPAPARKATTRAAQSPSIDNMSYKPTPAISAIPPLPDPAAIPKVDPTGNYNAYDINAFETIWYPYRQAADENAKDEPGGATTHGNCPDNGCPNHELEFIKFWKKLMRPLVKPLGGAVRSYKFFSEGNGIPDGGALSSPPGDTFNLQATVPGSVHPEQMVIVSGHYDQTDSGPASAWDSAEGHATVFRIAKIMMDYWKKSGTRPAVSVKFSAWGAEEAGTFGSQAFIRDQLVPFPSRSVRGYFNLDPCGAAYPAFYRGDPADRIQMVVHLADPSQAIAPQHKTAIENFNKQARVIIGDVFNHLDDTLSDVPTEPEIFVSDEEADKEGIPSQEPELVSDVSGLAAFSSDYGNFEAIGVPFLNLFPDVLGPHSDRTHTGYREEGISLLHTPNDNLLSLNAFTGVDQSGMTPSQGWYKGLEMCAHLHSWFMLQPNMAGTEKRSKKPVAYFEGLFPSPAPIKAKKPVKFDAAGSYAFSNPKKMKMVPAKKLKFKWNFGDGKRATGRKVKHAFKKDQSYLVTLTVKAPGGKKDVMKQYVKVGE